MRKDKIETKSDIEYLIYLRFVSTFKCGHVPFDDNTKEKINALTAQYIVSVERKQLKIEAVFACNIFKKTFQKFSEISEEQNPICLDNVIEPKLKLFFDTNYEKLKGEVERLFKLMRWKYSIGDNKLEYVSEDLYWSFEKEKWNSIVRCPPVENLRVSILKETQLNFSEIELLMRKGASEPIFLEMLREANSISETSLESGFVIAVAALEVGVKNLVQNLIPETTWLLNELQSPPISKIISEFFPILIPGFRINDKEKEDLKSIVSTRNKILHTGKSENDRSTLFKWMDFINGFVNTRINNNLR